MHFGNNENTMLAYVGLQSNGSTEGNVRIPINCICLFKCSCRLK